MGIESGDTDVLLDSKRTTIAFDEQIYKVKKLEENNVKVKSMYILGQPTDTLRTCLKTINYSKKYYQRMRNLVFLHHILELQYSKNIKIKF